MGEFIDSIKVTIKESVKFMLLAIFLFLLIGTPLAYISLYLNIGPKIAGTVIGITVAILVFVVDYKKFHCLRKMHESRNKFAMKLQQKWDVKNDIKMKETWVQDVNANDVQSIIANMTVENAEYIQRTGSKYIAGPSRNKVPGDVGIYFRDHTGHETLDK